jgi:hypothetical protein
MKKKLETTRLSYTVTKDKHKALDFIRIQQGYKSLQQMIDQAIDEKYGTMILELKMKGLVD